MEVLVTGKVKSFGSLVKEHQGFVERDTRQEGQQWFQTFGHTEKGHGSRKRENVPEETPKQVVKMWGTLREGDGW